MPGIEKISIALPPEMLSVVRDAVEAGEYASNSEVVRDALRDWTRKRALQRQRMRGLQHIWKQALKAKTPDASAEEVLDRLERKYRQRAEAAGSRS